MTHFGRFCFVFLIAWGAFAFTPSGRIPASLNAQAAVPSRSESPWALDRVLAEGRLGSELVPREPAVEQRWQRFLKTAKSRNINVARAELCETSEPAPEICSLFSRPKKSMARERTSGLPDQRQVARWLKDAQFTQLEKVPLGRLHGGLRRLKTSETLNVGHRLLQNSECLGGTSLPTALGSKLEESFPDENHMNTAIALFERAARCGQDEASLQGQYRLGLIEVWQGRCEKAKPAFDRILHGLDVESLQVRARYWMSYCLEKTAALKADEKQKLLDEKWSRFPLSYHTLLSFNENADEPFRRVASRPEPTIVPRSEKAGGAINQALEAVEFFLEHQENGLARHFLSLIDPEEVGNLEAPFRIYLAALYHRLEDGLGTFRVLYRVINEDPQYQSLSVFKMYYPLWFFDEIKRHAGGQDPVLILSLVRQESAFNPNARSSAGARGLMQLMPRTARSLDRKTTARHLAEPDVNLRLGTLYLDRLMQRFRGNVNLTLASYNAGAAQVGQWQKRYPTEDLLLLTDLMPFKETREYVAIIQRNYYWYSRLYPQVTAPEAPATLGEDGGTSSFPFAPLRTGELRSF